MRFFVLALGLAVAGACGGAGAPEPPAASPTPIPGAVLVTRANDHGTVRARVGDTIQIALGTEYEWRVDPPDGVVLARDPRKSYLLVRGTQAIWVAAAPGRSIVTATGTVICPSGQACIMIAILFTTTVVVDP
jgi:hypothetical protein